MEESITPSPWNQNIGLNVCYRNLDKGIARNIALKKLEKEWSSSNSKTYLKNKIGKVKRYGRKKV